MSLVIGTQGKLSTCILRFVDGVAKRTDAIVYDFTSLHRATGEKLVDVDGYVTQHVPSDYPELPGPPKPAPLTSWTEAPMVLAWVPEEEALQASVGPAAPTRVLVESGPHRKELVDRLLDLGERVGRVKVSPEAEDRRNRLSFEVARATALIEGSDPRSGSESTVSPSSAPRREMSWDGWFSRRLEHRTHERCRLAKFFCFLATPRPTRFAEQKEICHRRR